eukprot:5277494-Amphidinium_carterae.2
MLSFCAQRGPLHEFRAPHGLQPAHALARAVVGSLTPARVPYLRQQKIVRQPSAPTVCMTVKSRFLWVLTTFDLL